MPITVNHVFTSPVTDGTNTQLVRPSNWNSVHLATFSAAGSEIVGAFSNANGISFGLSGTAVTGSYTVPTQTVDTNKAGTGFSSTTTAGTAIVGTLDTNGLSLGVPAYLTTAQPVGAYLTTAAQSDHSHGAVAFSGTNVSGSFTSASNGLSINLSAGGGGAGDGYNIIAAGGSTAASTGTIVFSNSNGVSFGLNGATVTASHNGLTTAAASNHSHAFATTTTNGASIIVGTSNSDGVTIGVPAYLTTAQAPGAYLTTARASNDAIGLNTALTANGVSVTANSSGLSLNFPAFLTTAANSTHSHNFATTTTNGASIVVGTANSVGATIGVPNFLTTAAQSDHSHGNPTLALTNLSGTTASASNGLTISLSAAAPGGGGAINVSAGTTSGNLQTIQFNNGSNVSFGLDGSTITASVAGHQTESYFAHPFGYVDHATQTQTVAQSTSVCFPIELRDFESFGFMRQLQTVSLSSMASIATTANTTFSYNRQGTQNYVLYSRGTGVNSQSLQFVGSTQHTWQHSINFQANANGSQWSVSHGFTFPNSAGNQTSFSSSYATSLSNINISTTHLTVMTGVKFFDVPWASSLEPGQYWMVSGQSTTQTTNGTANLSTMSLATSGWGYSQPNNTVANYGSANNASVQILYGLGSFSTAGGGTTASIPLANISSSASHVIPLLTLARIA